VCICFAKTDSHITCRAHVVHLPCRATKSLECVFPIWFTQCGRVGFTLAMPQPCNPRPCRSSQSHGTARPPRDALWANCQLSASSGYHAQYLIFRWPWWNQTPFITDEEKVVAAHYKKDDVLHCWTSSRIFPATMRTFTKDTALSEQGRGAA
jgi:hypothetical protein